MSVKQDYVSFPILSGVFFIIRINIIVNIFKFIITNVVTTIIVTSATANVYLAGFSNFIVYKLFLVYSPPLEFPFFSGLWQE